jgi:dTDP-4-amino-4,6-dideoxygalactose transaminase
VSLRRQLPVYSPLSASALVSGAGALFGAGSHRRWVTAWLEETWRTRDPLLTDSGTTALTLAMVAGQREDKRGIALPAYGCYDLVTAAHGAGVPVRWYDLDPGTLGPDWASLETTISKGVGALVVAHYYGVPVDMGRARELARTHSVLLIEDAAQGVGGVLDGLPLGSHGDLGVLSFGRGKGVTGGGGGALLINNGLGRKTLAGFGHSLERGRGALRTLVTTSAQWVLARPAAYAIPSALPFLKLGETVFRSPAPLRDIGAAELGILAGTLGRVEAESEARRRNAAWLIERLGDQVTVPGAGLGTPGYLRLPVMPKESQISQARLARGRELGIMPAYPRVLTTLPGPTATAEPFAGASALVRSLITLPVHSLLTAGDRERLARWFGAGTD